MTKYYSDYKAPIDFTVDGNVISVEFEDRATTGTFQAHDKDTLVALPNGKVNLKLTFETVGFLRTLEDQTFLDKFNRRDGAQRHQALNLI